MHGVYHGAQCAPGGGDIFPSVSCEHFRGEVAAENGAVVEGVFRAAKAAGRDHHWTIEISSGYVHVFTPLTMGRSSNISNKKARGQFEYLELF